MLSIIIPVFNSEKTIENCINSITSQDFSDYEILAVDDGSTDNSLPILNNLASQNPKIRVFTHPNAGVSYTRNIGLSNMVGDYFTFMDSDDIIMNNIYETGINSLKNNKDADVFTYSFCVLHINPESDTPGNVSDFILEDETVSSDLVRDVISYDSITWGGGYVWNRIIRRSFWEKSPVFFREDVDYFEDKLFIMDLLSSPTSILMSPRIGYRYHYKPNRSTAEKLLQSLIGLKQISDYPGLDLEHNAHRVVCYAQGFKMALDHAMATNNAEMITLLNEWLSAEPVETQQIIATVFQKLSNQKE